jgi:hypothetical protein
MSTDLAAEVVAARLALRTALDRLKGEQDYINLGHSRIESRESGPAGQELKTAQENVRAAHKRVSNAEAAYSAANEGQAYPPDPAEAPARSAATPQAPKGNETKKRRKPPWLKKRRY